MTPRLGEGTVRRTGASHSETSRQIVHVAMGGFALLLRWLTWWQALALAAGALAFNLLVLPRLAPALYRPGDASRPLHGILFYPASIMLLIALLPDSPGIVAAAWGILAAGDGIATLAGRAIGGRRWPWNREKTLAGSAAFVLAGTPAAVLLGWWCGAADARPLSFGALAAAAASAAIVAAAVETIPVRLDDNLSVAISAGATLWLASLVITPEGVKALQHTLGFVPAALALNTAFAAGAWYLRAVRVSGAIAGAVIGTIIAAALGWTGWILLFSTFAIATLTSKMGIKRKVLLGIAEERGGRRGAGNAIANTGVAAVAALVAVAGAEPAGAAAWAFAAALTAGGSDTVASEIGKAWGRTTWSLTSLQRVPPGTSGAMSLEGTAAGIAAAFALAALATALVLVPAHAVLPIVVAATLGSLLESLLGATLEAPGVLNNDMLNFINTAAAALIAAGAYRLFA